MCNAVCSKEHKETYLSRDNERLWEEKRLNTQRSLAKFLHQKKNVFLVSQKNNKNKETAPNKQPNQPKSTNQLTKQKPKQKQDKQKPQNKTKPQKPKLVPCSDNVQNKRHSLQKGCVSFIGLFRLFEEL